MLPARHHSPQSSPASGATAKVDGSTEPISNSAAQSGQTMISPSTTSLPRVIVESHSGQFAVKSCTLLTVATPRGRAVEQPACHVARRPGSCRVERGRHRSVAWRWRRSPSAELPLGALCDPRSLRVRGRHRMVDAVVDAARECSTNHIHSGIRSVAQRRHVEHGDDDQYRCQSLQDISSIR